MYIAIVVSLCIVGILLGMGIAHYNIEQQMHGTASMDFNVYMQNGTVYSNIFGQSMEASLADNAKNVITTIRSALPAPMQFFTFILEIPNFIANCIPQ